MKHFTLWITFAAAIHNGLADVSLLNGDSHHHYHYDNYQTPVPVPARDYLPPFRTSQMGEANIKTDVSEAVPEHQKLNFNYNHDLPLRQSFSAPGYLPPLGNQQQHHQASSFQPAQSHQHSSEIGRSITFGNSVMSIVPSVEISMDDIQATPRQPINPYYHAPGYLPPVEVNNQHFVDVVKQQQQQQQTFEHVQPHQYRTPAGYLPPPPSQQPRTNDNAIHHNDHTQSTPGYLPPIVGESQNQHYDHSHHQQNAAFNYQTPNYLPPQSTPGYLPPIAGESQNQNYEHRYEQQNDAFNYQTPNYLPPVPQYASTQASVEEEHHTATQPEQTPEIPEPEIPNPVVSLTSEDHIQHEESHGNVFNEIEDNSSGYNYEKKAGGVAFEDGVGAHVFDHHDPHPLPPQSSRVRTVQIVNNDQVRTLKVLETSNSQGVKTIKVLGPSTDLPKNSENYKAINIVTGPNGAVQTVKVFHDHEDVPLSGGYLPPAEHNSLSYRRYR